MDSHYVPAGLADDKVEFFVMNGEVMFMQGKEIFLFSEITQKIACKLREEIDADPKVAEGLELLGIVDPLKQIEKYAFCRYGDLDLVPDITFGGVSKPEYWDCGQRPCPSDGFICKLPDVRNGKLTRNDAEIAKLIARDLPNKLIAELRRRSKHTVDRQCTQLQQKIGCHSKSGIAAFAAQYLF